MEANGLRMAILDVLALVGWGLRPRLMANIVRLYSNVVSCGAYRDPVVDSGWGIYSLACLCES